MATPVSMPRQGQSVESCIISEWHFNAGDEIGEGDILLSYETDKASFELESPASGLLLGVFFDPGDEVPVLTNIAVIGKQGEDIDEFRPENAKNDAPEAAQDAVEAKNHEADVEVAAREDSGTGSRSETGTRKRISPRARKMATELHVGLEHLEGSGPMGRVIASDVLKAASGADRAAPVEAGGGPAGRRAQTGITGTASDGAAYTDRPLSNMRRIIAAKMHESLRESAQLTHHISADARKILAYRASFKTLPENSPNRNITINDMVSYAASRVLPDFPYLNTHFLGESIRTFREVHLGFAVDTERGLMVPALKNAGSMNLTEMSASMKELADRCRKGDVDPELLQSTAASFTVSNLGAFGIEMFTPVLNLPQTGILGVNTIVTRPADVGGGIIGMVPFIGLSLTYDHRAVDGAPASAFLKGLKEYIEKFEVVIG